MKWTASALLFLGALAMGACQAPPFNIADEFSISPAGFSPGQIERTGRADAFGQSVVLTGDNGDKHFGVTYITTNKIGIIKDLAYSPRRILKSWTKLTPEKISYADDGWVSYVGRNIDLENFAHGEFNCFHFQSGLNKFGEDEMGRYRRMVVGYSCRKGGGDFSESEQLDFAESISIPSHYVDMVPEELADKGYFVPTHPIRARLDRTASDKE